MRGKHSSLGGEESRKRGEGGTTETEAGRQGGMWCRNEKGGEGRSQGQDKVTGGTSVWRVRVVEMECVQDGVKKG